MKNSRIVVDIEKTDLFRLTETSVFFALFGQKGYFVAIFCIR